MNLTALVLLVSCSAAGCALTSKSDPTLLRYYSLDAPRRRDPAPPREPGTASPQLRLGRVNAASYIRERIAFRASSVEVGYYDDLRWTEKPESYVRRGLARVLFDDDGLQEVVGGLGPTLDVDVDAFEELPNEHAAVVQLTWQLRDDTVVLQRATVRVERPLTPVAAGASPRQAFAVALSGAVEEAVDRVARLVVAKLPAGGRASL